MLEKCEVNNTTPATVEGDKTTTLALFLTLLRLRGMFSR